MPSVAKLPVSGSGEVLRGQGPLCSLFRPRVTLGDSEVGDGDAASLGVQSYGSREPCRGGQDLRPFTDMHGNPLPATREPNRGFPVLRV